MLPAGLVRGPEGGLTAVAGAAGVGGAVAAAVAVAVADLISGCRSLVLAVLCLAQDLATVSSLVVSGEAG